MNKFTMSYKLALVICVSTLLIVTPYGADAYGSKRTIEPKKTETRVLGSKTTAVPTTAATPTVIPSKIPTPTTVQISTPTPTPTVILSANSSSNTSSPTATPTQTPSPTATPTPTAVQPSPTPTVTVAPTSTPTPTPTPAQVQLTISIDYAGQKANDSYTVAVDDGQNAWEAVKKAVGLSNLQFTDYGGSLGVFINGFNGVNASNNQFYEFRANGVSSQIGISSYVCRNGDNLSFVLTTF